MKKLGLQKATGEYLESEVLDLVNGYFDNDAVRGDVVAMERLEELTIGIPNNVALAGKTRSKHPNKSFVNTIDDNCVWRENKNGIIQVTINGEKQDWGDIKVSEIIATRDGVYYIDETDGYLYCHPWNEGQTIVIISEKVLSFAIVGDQIFALSESGIIKRYSLQEKIAYDVADNIQRFFVVGDLIVQNGLEIYSVGLDGMNKRLLVGNALLLGADNESVYFTDFGKGQERIIDKLSLELNSNSEEKDNSDGDMDSESYVIYAINHETGMISVVDIVGEFVRSVYKTEDGMQIDFAH